MSARTRLLQMAIATFLSLIIMTLACGCGRAQFPTTDAETEAEMLLVAETAQAAKLQVVEVEGVITERHYSIEYGSFGCTERAGCEALGWYQAGTAYYNRQMVEQFVAPQLSYAKDVATHEVCHAKHHNHDIGHWNCMARWATPTYPHPGTSIVPDAQAYSLIERSYSRGEVQ